MDRICNLLPVRCSNRLQQVQPRVGRATCSWEESSFILQDLTHVKYKRLIFPSRRDVQAGFERHFQEPGPESAQHLGEIRKAPVSLPIFHPCLWRSCCGSEALKWQSFLAVGATHICHTDLSWPQQLSQLRGCPGAQSCPSQPCPKL